MATRKKRIGLALHLDDVKDPSAREALTLIEQRINELILTQLESAGPVVADFMNLGGSGELRYKIFRGHLSRVGASPDFSQTILTLPPKSKLLGACGMTTFKGDLDAVGIWGVMGTSSAAAHVCYLNTNSACRDNKLSIVNTSASYSNRYRVIAFYAENFDGDN